MVRIIQTGSLECSWTEYYDREVDGFPLPPERDVEESPSTPRRKPRQASRVIAPEEVSLIVQVQKKLDYDLGETPEEIDW